MIATPLSDLDIGLTSRAQRRMYLRANMFIVGALFAISIPAIWLQGSVGSDALRFALQRLMHNIELSIPTLYNFALLAFNFALLVTIAAISRLRGATGTMHWAGLAVLFLLMTYDEAVELHEELNRFLRTAAADGAHDLDLPTIAAVGVVCVVALAYIPFLRALPGHVARLMVLAGALYVSGAILVDTGVGWVEDAQGQGTVFHLLAGLEESFEMIGMAVFGYALLVFLATPWAGSDTNA